MGLRAAAIDMRAAVLYGSAHRGIIWVRTPRYYMGLRAAVLDMGLRAAVLDMGATVLY